MHTSRRTFVLVIFFLLLVTSIFFNHAILSRGQFFLGDISQNHYPVRKLIADLQGEGVFPLWNPYISSGQPLYANPNALVFHPVSLFYFALPFESAFKYSIIFQYLLCAAGMYLFAREIRLSVAASVLSSLLFAFSGFLLSLGHLYNLLCGAAWIPLFLFFVHRSFRGEKLSAAAASVLLSVILLSAEPFFIVSSLVLSATLLFVQADPQPAMNMIPRRLGALGIIIILAFLLSAFFLLPAGELFMNSERSAGLASDAVSRWSLTPVELLGIFIPDLFGDPLRLSPFEYWGALYFREAQPLFPSLYIGIPALILAFFAFLKRDRLSILLWIISFCALFLALGSNIALFRALYDKVPFSSSFRYTSKFFILFSFSISILAAKGLDAVRIISREKNKKPCARASLIILPACMTLFLMGIYYAGKLLPQETSGLIRNIFNMNGELPQGLLFSMRSMILGSIIYASGMSLIVTIVLIASFVSRIGRSATGAFFISIVIIDLFIANAGLNPVASDSFYRLESPFSQVIEKESGLFRIYRDSAPKDLKLRTRSGLKEEGFFWNRMVLLQWTALPERFSFAFDQNVDRLGPYRPSILRNEAREKGWSTLKKILAISNVRYLILFEKISDPELSEVMEYDTMSNRPVTLYRNNASFPMFYAVPGVKIVQSEEGSLREILSEGFHPQMEAVVLAGAPDQSVPDDLLDPHDRHISGESGRMQAWVESQDEVIIPDLCRIRLISLKNNSVKLTVDAQRPGFLVDTGCYYAGWTCRVNGRSAPLFQTNYFQKGVPFDRGSSTVEFFFRPRIFFIGAAVSSVTLGVLIVFAFVSLARWRSGKVLL